MSQLTMQYLGEYDRILPGFETEVTRFEQKIAQAFKEASPLTKVEELEEETTRVRKVEAQVGGLLRKYWTALGELDRCTFAVQFDALESQMNFRRGYLEFRKQVFQLLSDDRDSVSRARQIKKRFCEMAEDLTRSLVEKWPSSTECPFQPVTAEEIADYKRRFRHQGRQAEQPE